MVQVTYPLPTFTLPEVRRLARALYGVEAEAEPLPGERDQNFRLKAARGAELVLKIANASESRAALELQHRVLAVLNEKVHELATPRAVPSLNGETITTVRSADGTAHLVRALTYLPGRLWAKTTPHPPHLLHSLGQALAWVDSALRNMPPGDVQSAEKWDLARAGWITPYLHLLAPERRALVERLFAPYQSGVASRLSGLPSGLLHNDANDYNLLVTDGRVSGLLDFGDMTYGARVCELAIGIAYAIMDKPDPLTAAAHVLAGYHQVTPLSEAELEVLYPLICARLCVSVTNSALQRQAEPGNEYLLLSERPAWAVLERFGTLSPRLAHYTFRAACGLEACPATTSVVQWLMDNAAQCGPVVAADLATESVVFDLSVGSTELGTLPELRDPAVLSPRLSARMKEAGARAGIGRYNEARLIYTSAFFSSPGNDGVEWRTVHTGMDVFMEAGAPVLAPLDGVVLSAQDNAGLQDYGPTIILEHAIPGGPTFYTLYGHLSRESVSGVHAGQAVSKGDRLGEIGDIPVNGGWPPHLHFQIITDLLDRTGEFPGVAHPRQCAVWLSLCPDPNLILRIPPERFPAPGAVVEELLEARRQRLGRNLSITYREPLHIVRGYQQYLYDAGGRAYLDAINNVPHVGHCHPRVVRAGQAQMAVLNTNTRYLHENILRYADRLCATLPASLSVCYFVNSGSEASELALRLARTHTRSNATVVLDGAYHGNTRALVDISPYKYNGPGGGGQPPFVRKVTMPDPYRGPYRREDPRAGERYAAEVRDALSDLRADGLPRGSFIAESLMGSSGQIVLPDGFLRAAYQHVREGGGVCIADEVQVGLGRVGTHFWGFETQGVVPDIVIMGKPLGNGHPLGVVATTPEIAASFANGMEYFSTFGGNPVSCAIGLAVLDVIADEGLQANALRVGEQLQQGFRELARRHELIGDVRGLGLFLGVELVRDRKTLEPAPAQTRYITQRLKERGVLISIDGPLNNVLKIKPPLVFSSADAAFFVEMLDLVLAEDGARAA
jgi:4-aminobutyrate aminotransferase-like enzyme/Ser/Thr protein kinase RdoA (MazF antagonist)